MEKPSPVSRDVVECAMSPGLGRGVQNAGYVPEVYDVSSAQATQVHNTDNCVFPGKHCGGSSVAPPGPVAGGWGGQWWGPELVVCTP